MTSCSAPSRPASRFAGLFAGNELLGRMSMVRGSKLRRCGKRFGGRAGDGKQEPGFRGQGTGDRGQGALLHKIELRGEAATIAEPLAEELPLPRVARVAFDASIANWDADVETDGVLIVVAPLDIDQRLMPVSGTLE